jgi:4-hydroxy-tetrahydrodipicolinate synthase
MVRAVDSGDLATARAVHESLLPAVQAIMTRTQGAIMAKAALEMLGTIPCRTTRPPLMDATAEQVELLRQDLRAAGRAV